MVVKLSQLRPLDVPLAYALGGFFPSEHFPTFWHYKTVQARLVCFLPQPEKQPLLQGALGPPLEMGLETRTWVPDMRVTSGLGDQGNACV